MSYNFTRSVCENHNLVVKVAAFAIGQNLTRLQTEKQILNCFI